MCLCTIYWMRAASYCWDLVAKYRNTVLVGPYFGKIVKNRKRRLALHTAPRTVYQRRQVQVA